MKVEDMMPLVAARIAEITKPYNPTIGSDARGNTTFIKYENKDGATVRYKFQAQTIRFERMVRHDATQYSGPSIQWVRIKTYQVTKLYAVMVQKGEIRA